MQHDSAQTIYAELLRRAGHENDPRLVLTFPVELPAGTTGEEVQQWLLASGFTRVQAEREVTRTLTTPEKGKTKAKAETVAVKILDVVADRFRIGSVEQARALEAIEVALKRGTGRLNVYVQKEAPAPVDIAQAAIESVANAEPLIWRFSTGLHCPHSDLRYADPAPSMFSFNSAVGACEVCRGFGRVVGVDYGLVIPNDKLTLRAGAIKPMQTPAWQECQDDLMRHAEAAGIPRDTPWYKLTAEQKHWVLKGSPNWAGKWNQQWYGVDRFFEYLESKAYKMHIRVLLSKYRSYTECPTCGGARLKTESLLWRVGTKAQADAVLAPAKRFMPSGVKWSREQLEALPGLCLHDLMLLPLDRLRRFFDSLDVGAAFVEHAAGEPGTPGSSCCEQKSSPGAPDSPAGRVDADGVERPQRPADVGVGAGADFCSQHEAPAPTPAAAGSGHSAPNKSEADAKTLKLLLDEIRTRLKYLCEVGIGYLTLDRQSRTLSGGEVQRINLTTALGTSLVNTLFVLDEPSIGLHPRDMNRIVLAMQRLRDAGNTLVVVEHDPAVMLAADRMIDMGPGPGERGGSIVFDGSTEDLKRTDTLTGAYLGGRKQVGMGFKRLVNDSTPSKLDSGRRTRTQPAKRFYCPAAQSLGVCHWCERLGQIHLVQDVLAPALLRHFGKATETPGLFDRLLGAEQLSDVVFVDQSPIGKTARSNPVSYVGAWDSIRELLPPRRCPRSAATPPASSASTAATAAAPPAAARASSTSKCSSSATCTCAARTATASATAPKFWK